MTIRQSSQDQWFIVGPLIDDTDFKTRETAVAWNAAGMDVDLKKTASAVESTTVALTMSDAVWSNLGNGYYGVKVAGASLLFNGEAKVVGICDGVLPFESNLVDLVHGDFHDAIESGNGFKTDVREVGGNAVTAASDFMADVSALDTPANFMADVSALDTPANFMADVSALATLANQTSYQTALLAAIAAIDVNVYPVASAASSGVVSGDDITLYQGASSPSITITVTDTDGDAVDLSSGDVTFNVYHPRTKAKLFSKQTDGYGVTISGDDNNIATITYTSTDSATAGNWVWDLWHNPSGTTYRLVGEGGLEIQSAQFEAEDFDFISLTGDTTASGDVPSEWTLTGGESTIHETVGQKLAEADDTKFITNVLNVCFQLEFPDINATGRYRVYVGFRSRHHTGYDPAFELEDILNVTLAVAQAGDSHAEKVCSTNYITAADSVGIGASWSDIWLTTEAWVWNLSDWNDLNVAFSVTWGNVGYQLDISAVEVRLEAA